MQKVIGHYSPEATHSLYHLEEIPPYFEMNEAVTRYDAFLANGYSWIGGICLVDPDEFESDLRRVLSFHEKAHLHLQAGALMGPHVTILPGQEPILNRGVRIFKKQDELH